MKIAVDLRSLSSGSISGVENYALNLLEHMLAMDRRNSYVLFYNGFKAQVFPNFQFINAQNVTKRFPNKLLNLLFKTSAVKLERLIGDFDVLFMPNLNMISTSQSAKRVVTVHDLSFVSNPEFYDFKRRLWHKFLGVKKMLLASDFILAVSEYTKSDLINFFDIGHRKIKVIYPGVDKQVYRPDYPLTFLRQTRNAYNLPGKFFLLLNTVEPRKNLIGAIEAFESAKDDTHLVVAGKRGWKTSKIFSRLKNSRRKNKIHYIGYVKEDDKPALIKLASALLYPSFYEGFGFQALEAMAVGTPVLASSLTSLPEVVDNCGLLVNPYSTAEIKTAMREIEQNHNLRNHLIAKGFERVNLFNWLETAKQTVEALESVF